MDSRSGTDLLHVASWWSPEDDGGSVRCGLCPHGCRIADGRRGVCGVRENRGGTLFALTYGRIASAHLDPVEKKPLYHFHPGRQILSIGSVGCNFRCGFCQNHPLVAGDPQADAEPVSIDALVEAARRDRSVGIAYTYNEPFIQAEFLLDAGKAVRAAGLTNVLVTNGFVNPEPLAELLPFIDALNIDLKSADPAFYRSVCGGALEPVVATIRACIDAGAHVELTNLLVTGRNDSDDAIRAVVDIVASIDPGIPFHLSRYFPCHLFTEPPTPVERLVTARRLASERLRHVYVGNVDIPGATDTVCPECAATVVVRRGYSVDPSGLSGTSCRACGAPLRFIA